MQKYEDSKQVGVKTSYSSMRKITIEKLVAQNRNLSKELNLQTVKKVLLNNNKQRK